MGKLCAALQNRTLLRAGLESRLKALEDADELDELRRIEARLDKIHQHELSYAEPRAEGAISKEVHAELILRLKEERKELMQEHEKLLDHVQLLKEAHDQFDVAQTLVAALPQILSDVTREQQEQLVMLLIDRIDVDGSNQVSITLRLDPDVIQNLPTLPSEASPRLELPPSSDFQPELSGNSTGSDRVQHGQKVTAARCRRSTGCRPD